MIEIESASIEGTALHTTNRRREAIRTRQMYLVIGDDRMNKNEIAANKAHQKYAGGRVQNMLDHANSAVNEAAVLVKVSSQPDV